MSDRSDDVLLRGLPLLANLYNEHTKMATGDDAEPVEAESGVSGATSAPAAASRMTTVPDSALKNTIYGLVRGLLLGNQDGLSTDAVKAFSESNPDMIQKYRFEYDESREKIKAIVVQDEDSSAIEDGEGDDDDDLEILMGAAPKDVGVAGAGDDDAKAGVP